MNHSTSINAGDNVSGWTCYACVCRCVRLVLFVKITTAIVATPWLVHCSIIVDQALVFI